MSVAVESERAPARARSERRLAPLAWLFAGLLLLALLEVTIDAASGHSALIPRSPDTDGWLKDLGQHLGYRIFLIALLVSCGAYAGLVALGARTTTISKRFAVSLIGLIHLILFVGPVLLSTDVFSYIAYARMGVVHGINPYTHGPLSIVNDPIFHDVGTDWVRTATAYGPVYTLLSYPLALLGVAGALWAMKLWATLASVATLMLVWRCARMRGVDPMFALLAVALNPLYYIYGLGGAHNDLIMLAAMMFAVSLTLMPKAGARREGEAAAVIVAGALVKATLGVLLPFMILSRRRMAPIIGTLAALAAGAVVGYIAFGIHGIDIVAALNRDAALVSTDSFATEIAHLLGKPGVFPVDHDLLKAGLVVVFVHLLWRTWRGYDWIAASGWTLLAISVTSTWLLAWYTLWPLPLAVISRDRRLLVATLVIQGLFVIHQLAPLVVPVQ